MHITFLQGSFPCHFSLVLCTAFWPFGLWFLWILFWLHRSRNNLVWGQAFYSVYSWLSDNRKSVQPLLNSNWLARQKILNSKSPIKSRLLQSAGVGPSALKLSILIGQVFLMKWGYIAWIQKNFSLMQPWNETKRLEQTLRQGRQQGCTELSI